ncbi:MAG: DUF378 domain-containing protein [Clostridia bacterium]
MKIINSIILAILIIGAINWGSIGIFKIDLVGTIFGGMTSIISRIIFTLVGIAGLWGFTFFTKMDRD